MAQSHLQDVVKAWLVGLHVEIAPVIPRSMEWLDHAIREDEDFGTSRSFYRLTLHWARALGTWVRDGVSIPAEWEEVRECSDAALQDANAFSPDLIATDRLDDYMAFCFQAEQYGIGIAEFEARCGTKHLSFCGSLTPRELGYALCLHKARGQFERLELLNAGRKLLQSRLEREWLGRGQAIRAATWLKIVYWHHDPSISALQTILRAYDDMPNVQKPV